MGEGKESVPQEHDVNAKWDACIDLTTRRFVYSSLGGAFAGLLFFSSCDYGSRSPVTRWASIAFGAGLGIGSAYTDCSRAFDAPPSFTETSSVSQTVSQVSFVISFCQMYSLVEKIDNGGANVREIVELS
ncbi:hypothetical protein HID58_027042 [Brassica napus]|uniref:MICOS complex subunit MIC10 n=1 Tax=Brassica napus TaxID=3708 RepID=A0ABQ8CQN4_BRANA|nr:hypothetical protein HID58_027042 [Brassica napus]